MAFGEHEFRGARKQADGATEAEHQASAARQWAMLGRHDEAKRVAPDDSPECPAALAYLWSWFLEILFGLPSSGMAVPTITWEALRAWSDGCCIELEPWERRALVMLGNSRALILSETKDKTGKPGGAQRPN
jgi:hypothetical protein